MSQPIIGKLELLLSIPGVKTAHMSKRFIALFIFISFAAHADSISGTLHVDQEGYKISPNSDPTYLVTVKALNQGTVANLLKLHDGDWIVADGQLINQTIVLSQIEFVGLYKLLGTWTDQTVSFNFVDFNSMTVNENFTSTQPTTQRRHGHTSYRYSVAPTGNDSWRLFISDNDQVRPAKLTFTGADSADLQIFDGTNTDYSEFHHLYRNAPATP